MGREKGSGSGKGVSGEGEGGTYVAFFADGTCGEDRDDKRVGDVADLVEFTVKGNASTVKDVRVSRFLIFKGGDTAVVAGLRVEDEHDGLVMSTVRIFPGVDAEFREGVTPGARCPQVSNVLPDVLCRVFTNEFPIGFVEMIA